MTLKMTSKAKLITDEDLDVDRIFEVKIIDQRGRNNIKQKSFSIYAKKGTKDSEYPATEEIKNFLQKQVKELA
jgi:hypothetical protein